MYSKKRCAVLNCRGNRGKGGPEVHVFAFPKNKSVSQRWLEAIKTYRTDFTPSKQSKICELHFRPKDIMRKEADGNDKTGRMRCRLRRRAVPSLLLNCPDYLLGPGHVSKGSGSGHVTKHSGRRRTRREQSAILVAMGRNMAAKLKEKTAAAATAAPEDQGEDRPGPSPPASATKVVPSPTSSGSSLITRSRARRQAKTEEAVLKTIQQCEDQQLKPTGDRERQAFTEWIRSVTLDLDHRLWRHFQQQITKLMFQFIDKNDKVKTREPAAAAAATAAAAAAAACSGCSGC
ncbi:uncharacterized protein LOC126988760 [Eriocheir sinensis]|uniref:uncharacterized protein LOC126988760 n=1 Tax=Eriocheir sinensis TaxID=95602 RepID=UPI0021C5A0C1|nr:uncharacterized protein LOC126988760 [Eriocheir sinensis]